MSSARNLNDDEDEDDDNALVVIIDEEEEENSDMLSLSSYSTRMGEEDNFVDKKQLEPKLLTLSGLASSKWANLPNLDLIKQRNKPMEPPKKPKSAPFFLPATETLDGFVFENIADDELEKENALEAGKNISMGKRKLTDLETPWAKSLAEYDFLLFSFLDDGFLIRALFLALEVIPPN
jgi:hypothetical protein